MKLGGEVKNQFVSGRNEGEGGMLLWVNPLICSEYVLFSLFDNKADLACNKT